MEYVHDSMSSGGELMGSLRRPSLVAIALLCSYCYAQEHDLGGEYADVLMARGYTTKAQGVARALHDAIAKEDFDLFAAATQWADAGGLLPEMGADLREAYGVCRDKRSGSKATALSRSDCNIWMMHLADSIVRSEQLTRGEIVEYSILAKDVLLEEMTSETGALEVLDYARRTIQMDVFPVILGFALKGYVAEPADEQVCTDLFVTYGERVTKDMLVVIAYQQRKSDRFPKRLDAFAREKFGISFDDLLKEQVDIDSMKASLELDKWPYPDSIPPPSSTNAPLKEKRADASSPDSSAARPDSVSTHSEAAAPVLPPARSPHPFVNPASPAAPSPRIATQPVSVQYIMGISFIAAAITATFLLFHLRHKQCK
jgi:hypothetical protein